jgi:F-type H+-transporting ATPase subunit b
MYSTLLAFEADTIQLVPDGTIILHFIIIALMVFLLNRTLFRPINQILQNRDLRTRGASEEARRTFASVDARMREYEQSLRRARTEGYGLLEQQRGEAIRERERQIADAREVLGRQTAEEKENIKRQADAARIDLSKEANQMAQVITSQMLGRPAQSTGE